MKSSVVCLAVLILFSFGCKDKDKIIEPVKERPDDIFSIALCPTLNQSFMKLFTESHNNQEKYPELFSTSVQEQIIVSKETDVYVSFVTEGASVPSTLGFYTYTGTAPASSGDIDKKIALPHVSNGILTPGDSRFIGRYPAGTVIGFFMIYGGYNNNTVNYSKPTYYTNYAWNAASKRQHVLFRESTCNNIVMSFEDKDLSGGDADADFNDIVFLISDNDQNEPVTSFETGGIVELGGE